MMSDELFVFKSLYEPKPTYKAKTKSNPTINLKKKKKVLKGSSIFGNQFHALPVPLTIS